MMYQEPCPPSPTEVISHSHQCQIDLMTSLHQVPLRSNTYWLTSSSLNLLDSSLLYYNMVVQLMSKRDTENPGFYYWLVFFNNIAINLSQYFTNNINPSIVYSCQQAWGTLQWGYQNNIWISMIALGFFHLKHDALMSRSNFQTIICIWSKKPQLQRY